MMHFCAITKSNECSLFACFESLQCPKIVLTVIKKGVFFKSFRGAALDPARGLTAPPRPPAGFHLGRPTLFYRATALRCQQQKAICMHVIALLAMGERKEEIGKGKMQIKVPLHNVRVPYAIYNTHDIRTSNHHVESQIILFLCCCCGLFVGYVWHQNDHLYEVLHEYHTWNCE